MRRERMELFQRLSVGRHGLRKAIAGSLNPAKSVWRMLSLLSEGPKHGYQLMKEMSERSGGVYSASAGSVYPTLQQLEDEGLIEAAQQGGRRVYRLTAAGREELERDPETVRRIWERAEDCEDWEPVVGPEALRWCASRCGTWSNRGCARRRAHSRATKARSGCAKFWTAPATSWTASLRRRKHGNRDSHRESAQGLRLAAALGGARRGFSFGRQRRPRQEQKEKKKKFEVVALERRLARDPRRRNLRPAGSERRGQVHHHRHSDHPHPAHQRPRLHRRVTTCGSSR